MAAQISDLSVLEAIETLSNMVDFDFDSEARTVDQTQPGSENQEGALTIRSVRSLSGKGADESIQTVKTVFRTILHYLHQCYLGEKHHNLNQKTLEGIRTIMLLVGEAARKLDACTALFHKQHAVSDLKEYRQLQEFYRTKIAKKVDEEIVSRWLMGFLPREEKSDTAAAFPPFFARSDFVQTSKKEELKQPSLLESKHVFINLEEMKKDGEYELFFIRKEDGGRFFSEGLLRNMKLVCAIQDYFDHKINPMEGIEEVRDRMAQMNARAILKSLGSRLDHYFASLSASKHHAVVQLLNQALIALLLGAQTEHLYKHSPAKNCQEYLGDFQFFLRQVLSCEIYQKWMAYPPKPNHIFAHEIIEVIRALCRAVFVQLRGIEAAKPFIEEMVKKATGAVLLEKGQEDMATPIGEIVADYEALSKLMRQHPNGPLLRTLETFESRGEWGFDSLLQKNLPNIFADVCMNGHRVLFLRIPAPVVQEEIGKARVSPEFLAFLDDCIQNGGESKHLLINLQDRTSWKEYARSRVLEKFSQRDEIKGVFEVATFALNTPFYHQEAPYDFSHQAALFERQFKDLLLDEKAGYCFPLGIDRERLAHFIGGAFEAIHHLFFSSKNVLTKEERRSFISIFYYLLELKLIEWLRPDTVSFSCKDGIDAGPGESVGFLLFFKLLTKKTWDLSDQDAVLLELFGPSLVMRERLMQSSCFYRMVNSLKVVESVRREMGDSLFLLFVKDRFQPLYQWPLFEA